MSHRDFDPDYFQELGLTEEDISRKRLETFLESLELTPTPDAIDQFFRVFLPALRIMCERGYDPAGRTWREAGWRPQLYESMKKMARIKFWAWSRTEPVMSLTEVPDLINYLGFYQRGIEEDIRPWGEWGEPA
jgi:hypothetical protein